MTNFYVSSKSTGKVNFLKPKVFKRRAWKTLNVISTLAIVLNTGLIGSFLTPNVAGATGTGSVCPVGNVKLNIGSGYEYNDGSGTIDGNGTTVTWAPATGFVITSVCVKIGGSHGGSLIYPKVGDGTYTSTSHDISHVVLYTDTVHICNLELTKKILGPTGALLDSNTVNPGDFITYKITFKNLGNANCTGGGVKIIDSAPTGTTYTNTSSNHGQPSGVSYAYSADTITWNAGTVTPNETGTVWFKVKVNTPEQCGDLTIKNKAQSWSTEEGTKDSNEVTTTVTNPCPICGDGVKNQTSEQCDGTDGVGSHQQCSQDCTLIDLPYCGDGKVNQESEQCDGTAGVGEHQRCTNECQLVNVPYCGDKIKNGNEQCDGTDGVGDHQQCSQDCKLTTLPYCGDGKVNQNSEECDGHSVDGRQCTSECKINRQEISGMKFNDLNGNRVKDEGERGLEDWKICISQHSESRFQSLSNDDDDTKCTYTDDDGDYIFKNLDTGTYDVWEEMTSSQQHDGWIQTAPNDNKYTVTIDENAPVTNKDFGNFKLGKISGYKFNDLDGDGRWDEGEPKLNGWTICSDELEECVVTGDDEEDWSKGYYEFKNLKAGTYDVYEKHDKDGWTQTMPGEDYSVNVTSGTNSRHNDFGNFQFGTISGHKYNDLNGNGSWDEGEPGLPGWTIQLLHNDDVIATAITAEDGSYNFTNLKAGTFDLNEVNQTGWTQTGSPEGSIRITSETNSEGNDFFNHRDTGRITFHKVVVGGTAKPGDFGFTVSDTTYHSGDDASFPTGTYALTETGPAGYVLTSASGACSKGDDGKITLNVTKSQEQEVGSTCTITNTFPVLTLAKVADPATVGGNQNVTYTITWSVAGAKATNVVVTDPIPANTTYVSMSCTGTSGTCTPSTTGTPVTSATWNLGTRNPGEGGTLTLVVKTAISVPNGSVIPNQAKIAAQDIDPVFAAADVKAATAPQLQITKTANATIVNPGDPITYTVQVKNIGTDVAHNAIATDTLPTGFTFVSTTPAATSIVGQTGTWNLGEMNVGDTKTISYTVNVAPGTAAGTYDNIAKAKADNASEVSTLVPVQTRVPKVLGETTNPVLQLRKSVSKDTVTPGDTVIYTVEIKNTGTGSAINVILTDLLPVGFAFKGTDLTSKEWKLGDLAVGETKTVSYQVTVGKSVPNGSYENLAIAQADNHGKVTTSVPVNVKRGRVLGETVNTGASVTDLGIAGVGLSLIILGFVLTRKRGEELA